MLFMNIFYCNYCIQNCSGRTLRTCIKIWNTAFLLSVVHRMSNCHASWKFILCPIAFLRTCLSKSGTLIYIRIRKIYPIKFNFKITPNLLQIEYPFPSQISPTLLILLIKAKILLSSKACPSFNFSHQVPHFNLKSSNLPKNYFFPGSFHLIYSFTSILWISSF